MVDVVWMCEGGCRWWMSCGCVKVDVGGGCRMDV